MKPQAASSAGHELSGQSFPDRRAPPPSLHSRHRRSGHPILPASMFMNFGRTSPTASASTSRTKTFWCPLPVSVSSTECPTTPICSSTLHLLRNPHFRFRVPGAHRPGPQGSRVRPAGLTRPRNSSTASRTAHLSFAALHPGGKSYLTIAFGCTGGQHRSVMIAEDVGKHLRKAKYRVKVDIGTVRSSKDLASDLRPRTSALHVPVETQLRCVLRAARHDVSGNLPDNLMRPNVPNAEIGGTEVCQG